MFRSLVSKIWAFFKLMWKALSRIFKSIGKGLKTVGKWIRHPLKSLWRFLSKIFVSGNKSVAKRIFGIFIAYITMMYPGTIATTYVSTYPFTKSSLPAVLTVMQQSGFEHYLTYGIGPGLVAGAQSMFGELAINIGTLLNDEQTIATGRDWAEKGLAWSTGKLYGLDGIDVSKLKMPAFRWPWEEPDMTIFDGLKAPEVAVPTIPGEVTILPPDGQHGDDDDSNAPNTNTDDKSTEKCWTEWDETESPDYWRLISDRTTMDVNVENGTIKYFGLDELGRTQRVVGMITYDMVLDSAGKRSEFEKNAEPSGWPESNTYCGQKDGKNGLGDGIVFKNGKTYHGYLWNRSHLIADALGGYEYEDGVQVTRRVNLITGTRAQNVGANDGQGGMQYCESLALNWLNDHKDMRLWYSAEPIYEGDELIPRSVIVKMLSEDGSLQGEWEIYNCAKGYEIDYYTGSVTLSND